MVLPFGAIPACVGLDAWLVASKFLGVLISKVCTWNSFLKFREILGKEGSLLILNQFSIYIPHGMNFIRQGYERVAHASQGIAGHAY